MKARARRLKYCALCTRRLTLRTYCRRCVILQALSAGLALLMLAAVLAFVIRVRMGQEAETRPAATSGAYPAAGAAPGALQAAPRTVHAKAAVVVPPFAQQRGAERTGLQGRPAFPRASSPASAPGAYRASDAAAGLARQTPAFGTAKPSQLDTSQLSLLRERVTGTFLRTFGYSA